MPLIETIRISHNPFLKVILSGSDKIRGIIYYRIILLACALVLAAIGISGQMMIDGFQDSWWVRGSLILLAIILFFIGGREEIRIRRLTWFVYSFFIAFTCHLLFSAWLNHFSSGLTACVAIAYLSIGMSFRKWHEAVVYYAFCMVMTIVLISLSSDQEVPDRLSIATFLVIGIVCSLAFTWVKDLFMSRMKMNRDLLRSLVNKTENGIFIVDTQGIIQDINPRASEMFGFSKSELVGQDFSVLRVVQLTDEEVRSGLEILELDHFWNLETQLQRRDGSVFFAHISIGLIDRPDSRFLVYRVRDISRTKQIEADLLAAKEEAEEAVKAKALFLATMSHEIRTPLNGVVGMTSLLHQTTLSERQKEYVETIQRSGQNLMVLINDILDYSKIESGRAQHEPEPMDISECVLDVVDLLRPHAESKGLRLEVDIDQTIPSRIMTVAPRINQVLLNLIGNAIKFTSRGYVRIGVRCTAGKEGNHLLYIYVEDSGMGIPAEKRELIFRPFSQVDASINRKHGGTGLGLAITHQVVTMLGGTIQVDSAPERGSRFSVELPVQVVHESSGVSSSEACHEEWRADSVLPARILIAEDNLVNRNVMIYMLEVLGLTADVASNGNEAIYRHERFGYDIIFMDVQMPEMDGLEATRVIRGECRNQPFIVAMTANNSDEDRHQCALAGMDAFIAKPFVVEEVRKVLMNWQSGNRPESGRAA